MSDLSRYQKAQVRKLNVMMKLGYSWFLLIEVCIGTSRGYLSVSRLYKARPIIMFQVIVGKTNDWKECRFETLDGSSCKLWVRTGGCSFFGFCSCFCCFCWFCCFCCCCRFCFCRISFTSLVSPFLLYERFIAFYGLRCVWNSVHCGFDDGKAKGTSVCRF